MHHCFRPALDTANSTGHEPAFAASPANRNSRYADEGHQTRLLIVPKVMYSRGGAANWLDPRLDICRSRALCTTLIPSLASRRVDGTALLCP